MKTILAAFTLSVFLYSCMAGKKSITDRAGNIFDTKWILVKIHDQDIIETNGKMFIKFNAEKNSAGGNGGCNSFGSNFRIAEDSFSFTNIFSTKMYCEDAQKLENSFFALLKTADHYKIKSNSLFLYKGKNILLEFKAE